MTLWPLCWIWSCVLLVNPFDPGFDIGAGHEVDAWCNKKYFPNGLMGTFLKWWCMPSDVELQAIFVLFWNEILEFYFLPNLIPVFFIGSIEFTLPNFFQIITIILVNQLHWYSWVHSPQLFSKSTKAPVLWTRSRTYPARRGTLHITLST